MKVPVSVLLDRLPGPSHLLVAAVFEAFHEPGRIPMTASMLDPNLMAILADVMIRDHSMMFSLPVRTPQSEHTDFMAILIASIKPVGSG